jgi:transketolase
MAAHGGAIPFGGTFLIFSDYMRPAMRLAALMGLHVIYVFTHDSIGLGEDGPTHQPVEQLLGLRSIPNLILIRPADANEATSAWQFAISHREGPVALVFSRQKLPILDANHYPQIHLGVQAGGYVLEHAPQGAIPDIILIASGSEVHLALEARQCLDKEGIKARVVSLPSWHLFDSQPDIYKELILPPDVPILAIEAGTPLGWKAYVGPQINVIGVNGFGASAPGETVMRQYGFSLENVCMKASEILLATR